MRLEQIFGFLIGLQSPQLLQMGEFVHGPFEFGLNLICLFLVTLQDFLHKEEDQGHI
jgi:hypothetical protein